MLTNKEKDVLRLLMASFEIDYSINNIARECGLAPNGAYKILRKFEKQGILKVKNIANIKSYRINFDNEKTEIILELALIPELKGRIKYRSEDFKELKEITESCIFFGSYINMNKEAHDLDVLFILERKKFNQYKKRLSDIKHIVPVKIHDVIQTEEDLAKNILKKDKVILDIIRNGIIIWGQKIVVMVIKSVYKR